MATAEFFKFVDILNVALWQHHLLGSEIAQLEFHHLKLALFVVMLLTAHLTSPSRMSGSRSVITPSWLSESLRSMVHIKKKKKKAIDTTLLIPRHPAYPPQHWTPHPGNSTHLMSTVQLMLKCGVHPQPQSSHASPDNQNQVQLVQSSWHFLDLPPRFHPHYLVQVLFSLCSWLWQPLTSAPRFTLA